MILEDDNFTKMLQAAQLGNVFCQRHIVEQTLPVLRCLARNEDELHQLVVFLYTIALPRWDLSRSWVGHVTKLLTWRLQSYRRDERRRDKRFRPKLWGLTQ